MYIMIFTLLSVFNSKREILPKISWSSLNFKYRKHLTINPNSFVSSKFFTTFIQSISLLSVIPIKLSWANKKIFKSYELKWPALILFTDPIKYGNTIIRNL